MATSNLDRFLKAEAKRYRKRLQRMINNDTGNLSKSIDVSVENNQLKLSSLFYYDFQDKGVDGVKTKHGSIYSYKKKKPPAKAMERIANKIGVSPWAISTSIYRKGIKPRDYTERNNKNIDFKGILDAYNNDIMEVLQTDIKLT